MYDAEYVIHRLEDACETMLLLPGSVGPARLTAQTYGYVAELASDAVPPSKIKVMPSRAAIARMDEALPWLGLISNPVIRKVVAARSMVSPYTGKHLHSWRDVAKSVGASHEALRGWHAAGIDLIVRKLR